MIAYDLKTMQACDVSQSTVVALGTFDGCHLGHASVLRECFYMAKSLGVKSLVYSFDTIPKGECAILTLEEKIKAIRKFGIDYVVIDSFDEVRALDGKEFYEHVLKGALKSIGASCGFNYHFGRGASCGTEELCSLFEKDGGSVHISPKITHQGEVVCSTLIRRKIENGEVEDILEYMMPYSIYAGVRIGKGLGKKFGIATVNQEIPMGKVIPKTGVYITECEIGEDVYPSVTNVGYRPTTDGENSYLNVETHIIGYEGNLYSSYIRVNFYKYLREEKRFESFDALKEQISRDICKAKEYFGYRY